MIVGEESRNRGTEEPRNRRTSPLKKPKISRKTCSESSETCSAQRKTCSAQRKTCSDLSESLFPVNRDRLRPKSGTQKPVPSIGNATIRDVFFVLIIHGVTRHPDKSGLSLLAPGKPGQAPKLGAVTSLRTFFSALFPYFSSKSKTNIKCRPEGRRLSQQAPVRRPSARPAVSTWGQGPAQLCHCLSRERRHAKYFCTQLHSPAL